MVLKYIFSLAGTVPLWGAFAQKVLAQTQIDLIEPIGSNASVQVDTGIGTMLNYFNDLGPWVLSVAVGICTLWVLFGGIEIMVAGGDQNRKQQGRDHITWAIAGLTMLMFAGFILRSLNSMFFV